jgi:hypothetical protein
MWRMATELDTADIETQYYDHKNNIEHTCREN